MKKIDNGNNMGCGRSDDIVAYIYDEIASGDRISFENHLADCTSCTDEFAVVSDARFSVFEWHKEEFTKLSTPDISIPYQVKSSAARGIFATIGEIIRSPGWLVPAAAAIVLVAGIGVVMFTVMRSGENNVARVEVVVPEIEANRTARTDEKASTPEIQEKALSKSNEVPVVTKAKALRPIDRPAAKRSPQRSQRSRVDPTPSPKMMKAPVLSNYEENVDRSLRLSDLLAEVGG